MRKHHARTRARHFGDNPRIRGGKERRTINWSQPWERRYAKTYRRLIKVRGHTRHVGRKKVRVHKYTRLFKSWRKR